MTTPIMPTPSTPRRSLDALFSNSARRYPDHPALFVAGRSWSYGELDAQSRAIERALHATGLAGGGRTVGLIYARAMFSYAAIIAIMRANCVYVPLNIKAPAERLLKLIDDADIEGVIIDTADELAEGIVQTLRSSRALRIIIDESGANAPGITVFDDTHPHRIWKVRVQEGVSEPHGGVSPGAPLDPSQLAYIIYTSGSTGEPKGVAIAHESACRCMEKLHRVFETHDRDRFTQFCALSFDYSLAELFWCWTSGGCLCVPDAAETLVPLNFAVRQEITVWFCVPSLASFLLKLGLLKSNALPRVRISLFGGEALPFELAHVWTAVAPGSRIFNLYGPTEVTIVSTYYEYDRQSGARSGMVPIGVPLPRLHCLIVDDGRVVERDDVPGELWLAGDQLAAGYWKNPSATQAAFVHFKLDETRPVVWYRTGDLVSQQRGVGVSFRGRIDRQVKLRGFRIELQEIESVLRDVIGCALVAVVPLRSSAGVCERIVAYCDHLTAEEATIKDRCLSRLPSYMVPERIFELDPFPLSNHGKIDYLALAARAQ